MRKMHLEMKESVYFSGNVALVSLRSSDNFKRIEAASLKKQSTPYYLLGVGI